MSVRKSEPLLLRLDVDWAPELLEDVPGLRLAPGVRGDAAAVVDGFLIASTVAANTVTVLLAGDKISEFVRALFEKPPCARFPSASCCPSQ
jgi:hypothetical protein